MAAMVELSRGAVAAMSRMEQGLRPVLQVTDVRPAAGDRYLLALSDGAQSEQGVLVASMAHLVRARAIRAGTIIRVLDYLCGIDSVINSRVIIVLQLEILAHRSVLALLMGAQLA